MAKTVVVTGTASGIGRATVEKFAAEGWNVVATVRRETDLQVHADIPNVRTLLLDVDDETADVAFAETAIAQFGQVDALVNNAGHYQMGPLEASTSEQIHRQFQTNVFGLIALTKAFTAHFRSRRSGIIVNLASISAEQGYPYTSVYSASKAAVAALTEGLNIELAPFGIAAKAVFPSSHNTKIFSKMDIASDIPEEYQPDMTRFFDLPQASFGSAPSVAATVIYQAATDGRSEKVRYYAGPDAENLPRARQLLGPEWYWEEFRGANTSGPSQLWASLFPARQAEGALEKNF